MTAISRSKTSIYIVDADTNLSALVATDIFKGDIKSYSKSGGEKDVESDPVFGGYVDKEKPTSQMEISLEVVPLLDSDKSNRWDAMIYAKDLASTSIDVYTTASETSTEPNDKLVVLSALTGTGTYKVHAYNNCSVTVLDLEHNADDNRTYNMTMKLSPATDDGVANFMTFAANPTTAPDWTSLDNN